MMNKLRNVLLIGLILLLVVDVVPASARQNTSEAFREGMQSGLIALESNPSQAYFDTLFDPAFANRDAIFAWMEARAAALSEIEVTYSLFIFEANRAAYQKVVTGLFTQPYIYGNTNLPPTNEAVRFVWQGMMDANGEGKLTADYNVLDGFATFQEWGAIPLAEGQEHGELGLKPYDGGAPIQGELPVVDWNMDIVNDLAKLLTIDVNGNDATSPEFDPNLVVQDGYGLKLSNPLEMSLDAAVHQDDWSAGYFTVETQPGTEIFVGIFEQSLTPAEALAIPHFAFVHRNAEGVIDLVYVNYDVLGITNQMRMNPSTILLSPLEPVSEEEIRMTVVAEEEALRFAELTLTPLATATPGPTPTLAP